MGMSHIKFKDTIFRTPLGGFINHANEAELCQGRSIDDSMMIKSIQKFDYKKWNLVDRSRH